MHTTLLFTIVLLLLSIYTATATVLPVSEVSLSSSNQGDENSESVLNSVLRTFWSKSWGKKRGGFFGKSSGASRDKGDHPFRGKYSGYGGGGRSGGYGGAGGLFGFLGKRGDRGNDGDYGRGGGSRGHGGSGGFDFGKSFGSGDNKNFGFGKKRGSGHGGRKSGFGGFSGSGGWGGDGRKGKDGGFGGYGGGVGDGSDGIKGRDDDSAGFDKGGIVNKCTILCQKWPSFCSFCSHHKR